MIDLFKSDTASVSNLIVGVITAEPDHACTTTCLMDTPYMGSAGFRCDHMMAIDDVHTPSPHPH